MPGDLLIPPGFVLLGGAALLPLLPRSVRSSAFLVFPLAALVIVRLLPDGAQMTMQFVGNTLVLCQVDQLSRVFGMVFAIIAFAGGIYAFHVRDTGEQVAALVYAGSSLCVTFAGDYLTLIVFWELMAISSTYLVWARRTDESHAAGMRYLIVHLFGGSLLLAGILLEFSRAGSLLIATLSEGVSFSSWLILGGIALNAAVPPLNAWLPDAYPRATVTGAVFLSAFTTKTAVYVMARVFPGWEILLVLGVIMTLYGVVFAVLSNDIRGILSYHIISQVGFMVAGVGIGTEMSLNGSTAHAYSHILYKALLFMGAGAVLYATGKSKLTELGGLYRTMPVVFWLYMVGAFSISGVPLFNGFISKSMVVAAAAEVHMSFAEKLLHLASVGTFLSIALKLAYGTWFGDSKPIKLEPLPTNMYLGMALLSALCVVYGVAPSLLYQHLPFEVTYIPFTIPHVSETVQMLVLTFAGFWMLRSKFSPDASITLDTDWFYRRPAAALDRVFVVSVGKFFDWTEAIAMTVVGSVAKWSRNPVKWMSGLVAGSSFEDPYSPDAHRPPMELVIGLVLLSFSVIALVALVAGL